MNCLEFRRRLGSEPACSSEDFVAHRSECAHCAAAHARAEEFESRIRAAFNVAVPANLADRILLAQTTEARHGGRGRRRGFAALVLAAAASIVVAVVAVNRPRSGVPELAAMVVDHLQEHVVGADKTGSPVPKQDVMDAFAARGVSLASVPDGINYVHKCPAGPYSTVHMVMPERSGPVSVVYVADKRITDRVDFSREDMRGRQLPLGKGSLVMVAGADTDFDAIERVWKSAMGEAVAMSGSRDRVATGLAGPVQQSGSSGAVLAAP